MEELKERIRISGLKQKFIADTFGISVPHLNMMLNQKGSARMSPPLRDKINKLLDRYLVNIES